MNKSEALKALAKYKESGCHMLIPTTQRIDDLSDQFSIVIDTVLLSGHPKDRDVYPHDNGTYDYKTNDWSNPKTADIQRVRIAKHGLDKLAILSGIIWSPSLCRQIRDPKVEGRIAYEAVGGVRKPDGTPYFIPKIYAMDIEVERQKLASLHKNDEYKITRDLLQKKSNISTLCESGARNRVTREILCLNNFYTVAELKKEFVMARIVPKLDLNDPYTKRRLVDLQLAAMTGIYGGAEPPQRMIECEAPIDIKVVEESAAEEPLNGKPDAIESAIIDFQNSDELGQCKALTNTATAKGYDLAGYLKKSNVNALTDFSKEKRTDFFKHLVSLPDKGDTKQKDDIPY
jgi:rhodanese-related sulfurtransferase